MEKRTLLALVALVALGGGAFFVLRTPEKGQRVGPAPRPFPEIKADSVSELDITSDKGEHTTLVKKGGGWRIKSAEDWGADPQALKSLTETLSTMTYGDLVTEGSEKHGELGVLDGKSPRVVVKSASGETLADLYVGKPQSGFTMVRPAGKNEVWQATKLFPYLINRDTKGWRDHTVFDWPFADVEKLTVEAWGSKLTVDKSGDKWKVAESTGGAPKTSEALDAGQVSGAVQAVSALKAADFAEDKKPAETGLEHPWLTLTAVVKGKPHTLFVGESKGDEVFVRTSDSPVVFAVKKFAVERLAHPPIDYRDKSITKVKADDLAGIDVTVGADTTSIDRAGDKWKARGKNAVDDAKVKPLAGAFESLSGSGFSPDTDPAKTGLAKPAGAVTLRLKDKQTITLKIGALTKAGDEYHVQKVGSPEIYLVKKFSVDRFLKKPADLAPATATANKK